jgi:DNA polymerase-3 subunit alpha
MLRLIEEIDSSDLVTLGGRSYPASAVVEDEDGRRWLLHNDAHSISPHTWLRGHSAGVIAIVVPLGEGDGFAITRAEVFMENRTEVRGNYMIPNHYTEHVPTWLDYGSPVAAKPVSASTGFVHLHTHTEYSSWDGLSTVKEIVAAAVADGQPALAGTDHGNCAVHPDLAVECKKAGIKPIFGTEAYFVDDRFSRDPETEDYNHLILLAKTPVGLKNLWASSTEAYRDGFYGKPRLDWDTLSKHREGLIASTGCLSGPVSAALMKGDMALAEARLSRLLGIFGDDLYMEIHTNSLPEQHKVNQALVEMARAHGVPLLGVVDSHFATQAQAPDHKAWMATATQAEIDDEKEIFGFNPDSWLLSEAEARDALLYLGADVADECIRNTVQVAEQCTVTLGGTSITPNFSKPSAEHPDPTKRDVERLTELCISNWDKTLGKTPSQDEYMARFEREMDLLIRKGFCGYFLVVADYVVAAKEGRIDGHAKGKLTGKPILVGPGRGSGGGSLVAYLSRITGVDPVQDELLFERFLTEGRTELPDFDVDFPASKKADLLSYIRATWGDDYVAVVGSHLRLKNKGIIQSLGKAFGDSLPETFFVEQKQISKIITDAEAGTAGLGLSWEDLWAQEGDILEPYRAKYPEFFEQAGRLVGRLKTYGKHAAGVVISTEEPLTDALPLRQGENDEGGRMVTQFEKDALGVLGYTKYDILTIRTLDTIQMCIDLIEEQRGYRVDVEAWKEEYEDPQVWDEICGGHTLGIFQIETGPGTALTRQMQPRSVAELADMITLVRPGPRRSGLTDTYLRRKDGLEQISVPDPRLEPVLAKTYGCLLYQEDIMAACMVLAGYDGNEADEVRSILGKKKVEKMPAAGEKFTTAAIERGMDHDAAHALWAQMAEFAKYSFNRAHAFAYAVIGYWCAWLKFHYPVQFLTAVLSTIKDKDRIPAFVTEARRMGYAVQPPDINHSDQNFTGSPLVLRYGFSALKGLGQAGLAIRAFQPYSSYDDFIERVVQNPDTSVNMGQVATLARIGAFDALVPNRRALETKIAADKSGESTRCKHKNDLLQIEIRPRNTTPNKDDKIGEPLPCEFDWASEPPKLGRTGKPLKNQPELPRKCSKACRNYDPIPELNFDDVEPYDAEAIRNIEHELLGVYLSSTPFDRLDEQDRLACQQNAEAMSEGPDGFYTTAGLVAKVDKRQTKAGESYARVTIETEGGTFVTSAFDLWRSNARDQIVEGRLAIVEIRKQTKGTAVYYNLHTFIGT